ncbi:MAG: T9SS type A sorting domain-containing protein [Candidatus Hydromicrobium sp.]|nr:T9SS type A sorting domain-containing protein [Candidatus Hydromicrobium sp.]
MKKIARKSFYILFMILLVSAMLLMMSGPYATITGSGGQTVTIEKISSAAASAGGFYIEGATTYVDLHLDTSKGIKQIQFTILGGAGVPRWWNGSSWIECSDYTIDAAGNVTTTITNSTTPSLSDLTGTVFTVVGKPAITVLGNTETTPVEIETVRTNPFTCWQVFVNDKNNFQLIFFWSYKNNNWLKIYDMNDKLVFQKDLAYNDPTIEVSLPDGMYKVKTYHDNWDKPLQEFIIGKP